MINIEPVLFTQTQIEQIENLRKCKYVCSSEHKDIPVEIFYCEEEHPVSKSKYFALYSSNEGLMITDGSFIEDQTFDAVIAKNGEIIYSRHRHDYRVSTDRSVFIDGGRSYTRTGIYETNQHVKLRVANGVLEHVI